MSKGLNEAGDLAIVMVDPQAAGGDASKAVVVLVPVSDYKGFVGNFQNPAAEGAVTHAKTGEQISVPLRFRVLAETTIPDPYKRFFIIRDQSSPDDPGTL